MTVAVAFRLGPSIDVIVNEFVIVDQSGRRMDSDRVGYVASCKRRRSLCSVSLMSVGNKRAVFVTVVRVSATRRHGDILTHLVATLTAQEYHSKKLTGVHTSAMTLPAIAILLPLANTKEHSCMPFCDFI